MLIASPTYRPTAPAVTRVERAPMARRIAGLAAPYLYLLPVMVAFGVWVYRPLVQTVDYSFYNWNLLPSTPKIGVGWANYSAVLKLPQFWQAVGTTGIFIGGMVLFGVVLPLIIGGLTHQIGAKSRNVYRAVLFLPVLISPLVAALTWNFLLAPNGGAVNDITGVFGAAPVNWLFDSVAAKFAIVLIAGWKIIGISVLIVAAGLAAINEDYYAAAAADGASRWQTFRQVTLPLLTPSLLFLLIVAVLISEAQVIFPLLVSLTMGGPNYATTDIYYLLYSYGFTSFDVGLASAAAVIFFIIYAVLALVAVALLDRYSFYDN
jgi:multiple sugar transport system permease protein